MKRIRFGGPALPVGTSTWFDSDADGRHRQIRANPGDEYPADQIKRSIQGADGKVAFIENADYYVNKGMAEYLPEKPTGGRAVRDKGKE